MSASHGVFVGVNWPCGVLLVTGSLGSVLFYSLPGNQQMATGEVNELLTVITLPDSVFSVKFSCV